MPDYIWTPITPLSEADRAVDLSEITPLYASWRASRQRLSETSPKGLMGFNQRLIRRLSIETGILEHLYDIDQGTTEALIAHGFAEDLVARTSTDIEPARLIDILRDQEAAIQLVMDCVASNRPLTKGFIHQLQAVLTRHQQTTTAVDGLGNRFEIPLLKGTYKQQPNNPRRNDGSLHEYCPPIHVDAEMDNLLGWYEKYADDDPILISAWLHHRFTQIHPYQDGNGRVSRALVTLVLLKAELLPLIVDRDLRASYIEDLEAADLGDLSKLVKTFARLERNAVLQGLSIDADEEIATHESLTSAAIKSLLTDKFKKRKEDRYAELRRVNVIALGLRKRATEALSPVIEQLRQSLETVGKVTSFVNEGGTDFGNGYWYRREVTSSVRDVGKFANFDEDHYFVKASTQVGRERFVFVLSFHHVGRELSGIMEATAFAKMESFDDTDERLPAEDQFAICSMDPFAFSQESKVDEVFPAFARWLDGAFAVGVREYAERL